MKTFISKIIVSAKGHLILSSLAFIGLVSVAALLTTGAIYARRNHTHASINKQNAENKSGGDTSNNSQDKSLLANNPDPNSTNPSSSTGSNTGSASTSSNKGGNQAQPSPSAPAPKVTNWGVYIYQKNITTCGTASNPCPLPAGLVLSIVAKDNVTGTFLPLKDCSITAGPDGTFSIPGGSFSANPTVYPDVGVPVCGGALDFPVAGHYIINYEVWPADSVNMDLRYRGGKLMDFYVKN